MPLKLNGNLHLVCIALISQLAHINQVSAGSDCVFDEEYYSPERYRQVQQLSGLVWSDTDSRANILLSDGAQISIKHWACNHLGLEAKQFIYPAQIGEDIGTVETILRLGALILDNDDFTKLKETIESVKVPLQPPVRINIPDSGYSEFFVALETASDSLIITIKYYRD